MRDFFIRLRDKGFFTYMGKNILIIVLAYTMIIFLAFLIGKYLIDFEALFVGVIARFSDNVVLLIFFASESFTGIIPVDLFVVWTQKFEHPMPYLALLGILSYTGGVISYGIGQGISRLPRVNAYTERKLHNYIGFIRKWGAAFIVIAALFPFTPFSLVVIAVSMLKYPFRLFMLFAIARLIRFALQGAFFFDLLKVDTWIG
jgi:membrane protein YqaA with SNARE-associated domain